MRSTCAGELLDGSLLDLALNLPLTPQLPYRGYPITLDCSMLCAPDRVDRLAPGPCPRPIATIAREAVCAACSWCWQRQSAWLCLRAESQRPPSLFEPPLFHPGSVNGQTGVGGFPWKLPPGAIPRRGVPTPTHTGQYDQEVVAGTVAPPGEPPGFGSQSLRLSNACASW